MKENLLGYFSFTLDPPARAGRYLVMKRENFENLEAGEGGMVSATEAIVFEDDGRLLMSCSDGILPNDDFCAYAWASFSGEPN